MLLSECQNIEWLEYRKKLNIRKKKHKLKNSDTHKFMSNFKKNSQHVCIQSVANIKVIR